MASGINHAALVTELQNLRGTGAQMGDINSRKAAIKARLDSLANQSTSYTNTIQGAYQAQRERQAALQAQQHANQNANLGVGSGGGNSGGVRMDQYKGGGQVDDWIGKALGVLKLDSSYVPGIRKMIMHESGGNPNAINKWDSNWKKGTPSMGLMQTIAPTFNAWKLKGYDNVYDPVANIIAGVRYAQNRYGSNMLRQGGRRNSSGNYIGY